MRVPSREEDQRVGESSGKIRELKERKLGELQEEKIRGELVSGHDDPLAKAFLALIRMDTFLLS